METSFEEQSAFTPKLEQAHTISVQDVLQSFAQTESKKDPTIPPRTDIESMIRRYSIWEGPVVLHGTELSRIQSYCDYFPGSRDFILSSRGTDRTFGHMAQEFGKAPRGLPPGFTEYIEGLVTALDQNKVEQPLILLKQPQEVFNGQVIDGVHRGLAYLVNFYRTKGDYDPGISAFLGSSPDKKHTIRQLKQIIERYQRLHGKIPPPPPPKYPLG